MLSAFYRQFQKPEGFLGSLVGRLMAARNGRRSEWALGVLAPQSGDRVGTAAQPINPRLLALADAWVVVDSATGPPQSDARVQHWVEQIHQKIDEHVDAGEQEQQTLNMEYAANMHSPSRRLSSCSFCPSQAER